MQVRFLGGPKFIICSTSVSLVGLDRKTLSLHLHASKIQVVRCTPKHDYFFFISFIFIAGTFNIISLFNIIASRKLIKTDQDKMQQKNLQNIVKICK